MAEITDVDEVDRLAGMCQRARPQSVTSSFREVLGEAARVADQEGYFTPVVRATGERIGRTGAGRVRS